LTNDKVFQSADGGPKSVMNNSEDMRDVKLVQTKFILINPRLHLAVLTGRTYGPRNMYSYKNKLSVGPRNAGEQNYCAWERHSHMFPSTITPGYR